ncbi:ATP-binding protein [Thiotrichales bacterium 19X7-9]|nr:ATP-binding protein [Thiotrichales bacterium 19X7-9]
MRISSIEYDKKTYKVKSREGKNREFKERYIQEDLPKYAKIMASFANNSGGKLIFGITDSPRTLVGENKNTTPDEQHISEFLDKYFNPEINFQIIEEYDDSLDKYIFIVEVFEANKKPIICKKNKEIEKKRKKIIILQDGGIYYRYTSSTKLIQHAELRHIIDEEINKIYDSLIKNIKIIQDIGLNNTTIVNKNNLIQGDTTAPVYMTKDLANEMNWVDGKKSTSKTKDANNAYYVVRNIELKQGIPKYKPTDYSTTHPLTKTELAKQTKISSNYLNAVTANLGILNNPDYHVPQSHGKNIYHKFTQHAKEKILNHYPIDMKNRNQMIIDLNKTYQKKH